MLYWQSTLKLGKKNAITEAGERLSWRRFIEGRDWNFEKEEAGANGLIDMPFSDQREESRKKIL